MSADEVAPARVRLAVGVLIGLVGLAAMVRLVAGTFSGAMSQFAWAVTLVAMVPWVFYVAWRARRARLRRRTALVVGALGLTGAALVWVMVVGPVLALRLSFAAFALLWTADRPVRRVPGQDRFVRIEELRAPEDEPEEADRPRS